ncbi:hypothetical protein [Brucella intermedia]|uniref:hypothetical protein n=1 Tax=Brucella intermedia TaxID=94625 RepID=UPI00224AF792|nr:hypothetical protein [Brucella intermedia]
MKSIVFIAVNFMLVGMVSSVSAREVTSVEFTSCQGMAEMGSRFLMMRAEHKLRPLDEIGQQENWPFAKRWFRKMAADIYSYTEEQIQSDPKMLADIKRDSWLLECINEFARQEATAPSN